MGRVECAVDSLLAAVGQEGRAGLVLVCYEDWMTVNGSRGWAAAKERGGRGGCWQGVRSGRRGGTEAEWSQSRHAPRGSPGERRRQRPMCECRALCRSRSRARPRNGFFTFLTILSALFALDSPSCSTTKPTPLRYQLELVLRQALDQRSTLPFDDCLHTLVGCATS